MDGINYQPWEIRGDLLGFCNPKWARNKQIMWCCVSSRPIFGVEWFSPNPRWKLRNATKNSQKKSRMKTNHGELGYPVERHWVYHMAFFLCQYSVWTVLLNQTKPSTWNVHSKKCGMKMWVARPWLNSSPSLSFNKAPQSSTLDQQVPSSPLLVACHPFDCQMGHHRIPQNCQSIQWRTWWIWWLTMNQMDVGLTPVFKLLSS